MEFLDLVLNILSSGLPCCLLALGIFLTYRLLDFADLTAEGSFLISSALVAMMIYNGINPWLATLCGLLAGFACGTITGVLNRVLKIPKLLSGIITMTGSGSIAMLIMGQASNSGSLFRAEVTFGGFITKGSNIQTIYSLFYPWQDAGGGIWIVPNPIGDIIKIVVMAAVVVIAIVGIYFFFGTQYGMAIRATGMNERMARAQGINPNVTSIICVAIANGLIGLAGALYVQEAKTVSTVSATGYLVVGLASIIIGEAIFGKRSFKNWLISVSLGSIIYFIIVNVATRVGLPTELKSLLYAILVVLALCIPLIKSRFKDKKAKKKAMMGVDDHA